MIFFTPNTAMIRCPDCLPRHQDSLFSSANLLVMPTAFHALFHRQLHTKAAFYIYYS
jgi:hypothetical protein